MGILFAYILKSALLVIAYYLLYRLLLSRDTFHRFNRWSLLGIMIASIVLPLVQFSHSDTSAEVVGDVSIGLPTAMALVAEDVEITSWRPIILAWAVLLYWVGVVLFALRSALCYLSLIRILHQGERHRLSEYGITGHDDIILIVRQDKKSPFSWMHYIVVNEKDMLDNGKTIIAHELGHIHHRHTLDLLFTEICQILQWFNPAIWLMRRELQAIHEYQADEEVLNTGIDARQYQLLLIEKATGARLQSITCSLHQSSIKKRITMMLKKKSNPWARAKMLLAVPVAVSGIALFTTHQASAFTTEVSDCKVSEIFANGQQNGQLVAPSAEIDLDQSINNQSITLKVNREGRILMNDQVITLTQLKVRLKEAQLGDDAVVTVLSEKGTPTSVLASVKEVLRQNYVRKVQYQMTQLSGSQGEELLVKSETLQPQATQDNQIYTVVDVQPQFPGGESALMEFLKNNVKYPADCAEQKVQGRVILMFTVEKDGSVTNVEDMRSPDPRLTKEAKRVINSMPKWTPGKHEGKAVRVKYVLPVSFKLDVEKSVKKVPMTADDFPIATNEVFTVTEDMAEFPGGEPALMAFIKQNLKYPMDCANEGVQGRVTLSMIIEKDGSISTVEELRSPDPRLTEEAVRVVKSMPKWTPAKQRGQIVRIQYVLPITFRLAEEKPEQNASNNTGSVFTVCENMPQYPGGQEALMAYLSSNVKYPAECAEQGIQGVVSLSFVVEKDGSISNIEAKESPDPHLTEEAIRVVKSMPKWNPGTQRGHVVSVQYQLPITFRLS